MSEANMHEVNGFSNGRDENDRGQLKDTETFLFSSESVGEGHPGKTFLIRYYNDVDL